MGFGLTNPAILSCTVRRNIVESDPSRKGSPMYPVQLWWRGLVLAAVLCLTGRLLLFASDEPTLTKEQMKQFLLTAKVVNNKQSTKGVTHPWRLTLSDGTLTHDASFQSIDEHKPVKDFATGTELNFVDSYKYNIAAYALAELLGMDDMLPVYVERNWKGNVGSLSWWLTVKMDEVERHEQNLTPPDQDAWNNQMYKIRVFDELVSDSDPNLTNVLIGENWKIWRVDFSRAFRLNKELKDPNGLVRCERQLLEKLKALDANALIGKTKHYLTKYEVEAVMARREKIVAHFQKMISEKGANQVLY